MLVVVIYVLFTDEEERGKWFQLVGYKGSYRCSIEGGSSTYDVLVASQIQMKAISVHHYVMANGTIFGCHHTARSRCIACRTYAALVSTATNVEL
jgi:hypothetical protein